MRLTGWIGLTEEHPPTAQGTEIRAEEIGVVGLGQINKGQQHLQPIAVMNATKSMTSAMTAVDERNNVMQT